VALLQGVKGLGMAGPGETIGNPWPPLLIRACESVITTKMWEKHKNDFIAMASGSSGDRSESSRADPSSETFNVIRPHSFEICSFLGKVVPIKAIDVAD
jgi:hypothetical protein